MVLFLTGRCDRTCWYCPLSRERKSSDILFANDQECPDPVQIIAEAHRMSALGTGITGGEPLLQFDLLVTCCRLLKEKFGNDHHIHLYTGHAPTPEELVALSGIVDELRFHPPHECWPDIMETEYIRSIRNAKELGFSVGIEVPALPGLESLITILPDLDFLNINELEWGDLNAGEMRSRGYELSDNVHNAVLGARDWAAEICLLDKVHWCSSRFKDAVQLRNRLIRIAENTARSFDEITDDGTVVYGIIEKGDNPIPLDSIDDGMYTDCGDHVDMAWWLLVEYADRLPGKKYVIERYPDGGMIVEVTPL
ncbi:MAG: radical SAM protein [Methanoregulaceae archaeon]|nr:radical SAM protein [Methanoregulaceae archaeon]